MPELPEVETTCRGIRPHIKDQQVTKVIVRQPKLRWPVPKEIHELEGHTISHVDRRAKYLLLHSSVGTVIIHLGMSGNLRICQKEQTADKHDHVDIEFANGKLLRLQDPRRFGCVLWTQQVEKHPLIRKLGPEPLTNEFTAKLLYYECTNSRRSGQHLRQRITLYGRHKP